MEAVKIVLADDDEDDRILFREVLDELNINVTVASFADGQDLLEFLGSLNEQVLFPNIIFIDINMPRINGIDCLKEIRRLEEFDGTPIIIHSTTLEKETVETLHRLGANYCIKKSITFASLRSNIDNVLNLYFNNGLSQPSLDQFILNKQQV